MRAFRLLTVFLLAHLVAMAQAPVIHARLEPGNTVTVGAPVRLVVTVMVPNYFTGSPEFPELELQSAIVVPPQETPQNSSTQISGTTYAGITEVYTIYPQQPGNFVVPPAPIEVKYSRTPPKTAVAHLTLPSLTFRAEIPEAARGLSYFLPTSSLRLQQRWSGPLNHLRAGDAVGRTVTVTAAKTQAMLIPPIPFEAPPGIRVYPDEPEVLDQKSSKNEFLFGQRTQRAQYLLQKAGDYTLPAIEVRWWNLSTRKVMTAALPAVHIHAILNPGVAGLPPEQPAPMTTQPVKASIWHQYRRWVFMAVVALFVTLALLLVSRWIPRLFRWLKERRAHREETEAAYFHVLLRACKAEGARETYAALLRWLHRYYPGDLEGFLAESDDPELTSQVEQLGAAAYGAENKRAWDGQILAQRLKALRQRKSNHIRRTTALVDLNPTAPTRGS